MSRTKGMQEVGALQGKEKKGDQTSPEKKKKVRAKPLQGSELATSKA